MEAKYRKLVENSPEGIAICREDSPPRFVFVNSEFGKILGYSPEELLALSPEEIMRAIHPDDRKTFFDRFKKRMKGKNIDFTYEFRVIHKNGSIKWVEGRSSLIEYKGMPAAQGMFLDITERRKAEEALVLSEEKFRQAFAICPDAFLISTVSDAIIIDTNESFLKMFGYTKTEVFGKSALELGLWAKSSDRETIVQQLGSNEKISNLEVLCKRKNGETFPILLSVSLMQANNQKLVLSSLKDLSSYKQTEDALKESEEKFRNLAEESPNAIFINKRGRILYANKKCEEMTGYSREELYSPDFNFLSLCAPECAEIITSSHAKQLSGVEAPSYDYVVVTKSDKRIDVMATSKLINYDGDKAILGIVTDISELKKAQENLEKIMNELVNVNEKQVL